MKTDKTTKSKRPMVYAFIDSQNLNLGTSKDIYQGKRQIYRGWKLDYKKFRKYLSDKFRVSRAFLFIGYIKQNERLYHHLKSCGYDLVYKPTTKDEKVNLRVMLMPNWSFMRLQSNITIMTKL